MRAHGITAHGAAEGEDQLRARLVFEQDSITNIAHQLGYFETIASWRYFPSIAARIEAVTLDEVASGGGDSTDRVESHDRTVSADG